MAAGRGVAKHPPIDFFFRSLAEELGEHAIGIVLSGMGSDEGQAFHDFPIEHDFELLGQKQMKVSGSRVPAIGGGASVALLSILDVSRSGGPVDRAAASATCS